MLTLVSVGEQIGARRRTLGLTQALLARQAEVGHSTLDALENGRLGELGLSKIIRLLSALGLELNIQELAGSVPVSEDSPEKSR